MTFVVMCCDSSLLPEGVQCDLISSLYFAHIPSPQLESMTASIYHALLHNSSKFHPSCPQFIAPNSTVDTWQLSFSQYSLAPAFMHPCAPVSFPIFLWSSRSRLWKAPGERGPPSEIGWHGWEGLCHHAGTEMRPPPEERQGWRERWALEEIHTLLSCTYEAPSL